MYLEQYFLFITAQALIYVSHIVCNFYVTNLYWCVCTMTGSRYVFTIHTHLFKDKAVNQLSNNLLNGLLLFCVMQCLRTLASYVR